MPTTERTIAEIARDYAEGAELSAAIQAGAPITLPQGTSRESWARRWLDLSEWARNRELHKLEHDLGETFEALRSSSELAERRAAEALQQSLQMDAFTMYLVECDNLGSRNELVERLVEARVLREMALQALNTAAVARSSYTEAKEAVALAQLRSQFSQRHFGEVRRVRIRSVALTFLLTLVLPAIVAWSLHYWTHLR